MLFLRSYKVFRLRENNAFSLSKTQVKIGKEQSKKGKGQTPLYPPSRGGGQKSLINFSLMPKFLTPNSLLTTQKNILNRNIT
ncbi:MAG: hypothetical protein D6822_02950 [Cyanobacteria bacterium J149]|nr:MAG: hypothetical protein D6822_02950 [Cyanobacteria bacterium J149]